MLLPGGLFISSSWLRFNNSGWTPLWGRGSGIWFRGCSVLLDIRHMSLLIYDIWHCLCTWGKHTFTIKPQWKSAPFQHHPVSICGFNMQTMNEQYCVVGWCITAGVQLTRPARAESATSWAQTSEREWFLKYTEMIYERHNISLIFLITTLWNKWLFQ